MARLIETLNVCIDCYFYVAYGDIPESDRCNPMSAAEYDEPVNFCVGDTLDENGVYMCEGCNTNALGSHEVIVLEA